MKFAYVHRRTVDVLPLFPRLDFTAALTSWEKFNARLVRAQRDASCRFKGVRPEAERKPFTVGSYMQAHSKV